MCKSCVFGVLTMAIALVSASAAGDGENWHVAWFDNIANKAANYDAIDRADAVLFIHTHLQGINLATGAPAYTKIRLLKSKDGTTQPIDPFTTDVKSAIEPINQPVPPAQAADKIKTLEKEGWLKALSRSERKLGDSRQALGQRIKNEVTEIGDFRKTLKDDAAEFGENELKQINDVIANYNRIATEIRAGPLSASLTNLQAMKPLSGPDKKISARLARERLLTVQTKLKEIGLLLEQRELAESREQLRAEAERIGQDKEAGLEVRRREQELETAVNTWTSRRDDLQRRIEIHAGAVHEVFSARQAMHDLAEKNLPAPPPEPK